jgi:hypothetical protein
MQTTCMIKISVTSTQQAAVQVTNLSFVPTEAEHSVINVVVLTQCIIFQMSLLL